MSDLRLAERYQSILQRYLAGMEEPALQQAYELGRQALSDGLGVLEMATIHGEALGAMLQTQRPEECAQVARRATSFFLESVSAFEMIERGYREANVALRRVNEKLEYRTAELETANKELARDADQDVTMLATTPDGFWRLDTDGKLLEVNDAYCRMSEYSRDELLSFHVPDVEALEKPAETAAHICKVIETGFDRFESQHRKKDGGIVDVEISVSFWRATGQFLAFARDITQRKRAEAELRQRAAEMSALQETALDLVSHLETRPLLETIVRRATDLLGATGGILYEWEEIPGQLRCVISDQFSRDYTNVILKPGEGIAGRVYQTAQPMVVNDYPRWEGRVPHLRDIPSRAVVSVPILCRSRILGVLNISDESSEHTFDDRDVRLLSLFANQAAVAMENARLFEETQRRLSQIQTLREIDAAIISSTDLRLSLRVILEQIASHLRADAASVLLLNPYTLMLEYAARFGFRSNALQPTHLRLGEGHAGRAALERRIVYVANLAESQGAPARAPLLASEQFVAYYAAPLIAKGQVEGVLEIFHRAPHDLDEETREFLDGLAVQVALAIDNAQLFERLQRSNIELVAAYDATIEGWSRALDLRDKETEGHTQRVTEMTERLARAMGVSGEKLVDIRRGALLHDIGKVGVSDMILHKPGALTNEEWVIMRRHPAYADDMLAPVSYLRQALEIPYCHHEKWDGTGYPRGLKGAEIPLAARIFAVVDVWDALRSDRPYHVAWNADKAREYICAEAGKHFDPQVVEAFLKIETELEDLR